MSIIVLGTVALDSVKTPYGERKHMLGGSAVHFALACRLFTDVNLVAVIGKDFPQKYIDFLEAKGINLTSLIRTAGKTFKWEGKYAGDLNTAVTICTDLGVLLTYKPRISEEQKDIKYIFLANIDPELQSCLLNRLHRPQLVALDSMNYWIEHKRKSLLKLLKRVDIYVANDQEARALSGEYNLVKAARFLSSAGPKMVLIKKGEHGVLFYKDGFTFSIPAYPTDKVIDPTGAGDAFAGGFMGYLTRLKCINEAAIKKALAYGTVAASLNIEGFGVEKTSGITMQDLDKRLAQFRKTVLF
ncbi:MAG: sugar kinase [Omnitrophica WOR_2 bacterium RBG_13_44_8b]|nr:MAG: sugar kinase [Omnitrophica WOR_2 bacterium RBG_13_44_8b]